MEYKYPEVKKEYEKRLKGVVNKVNDLSNYSEKIMWNQTVNNYVQTMNKMKLILKDQNIEEYATDGLMKNLDTFVEKCKTPEFHIAFVGAIKAGKSTLINALLGKELASTSVTPETAALTKFRSSKGKDYIKLKFYNKYEWDRLWKSVEDSNAEVFKEEYSELNAENQKRKWIGSEDKYIEFDNDQNLINEIKRWTSSKEATHYFVKEVEVGLKDFNLPEQVVFIDTPGLDDPVKYRSDITRDYIDKANAVLVCVKADAMTGQELATIYSVFANTRYNPEKVYIVGTQLDTLNNPEKNWQEQRREWLKHLRQKDCFGSISLAEKNLVVVSAYLYSLLNNYDKLDEDTIYFDVEPIARKFRVRKIEKNMDKLKEITRVDALNFKLGEEIINKHQKILLDDLKQGYLDNKEDLINFFNNIRNEQQDLLETANQDIHEIRKKREQSLQKLEESQNEKAELEETLEYIKEVTTKRANELYKTIRNMRKQG
ncbi:dynamin family protein [Orenia metallireducens]|uniref:Dynamin family protein n=1 Tax=Orenia metallireducens TaxID=1413210 RepID=A0A285I1R6_9FIRM|nr:dynamin family protein [Orenia metallireducens]PRX23227.1 dynamin family protein [Orenia metallireducens]SNY41898.1 Dynamin family protein [Orenia metallireducens]